ncbi:hypothetical protein PG987_014829 [Apiospora arundinis]
MANQDAVNGMTARWHMLPDSSWRPSGANDVALGKEANAANTHILTPTANSLDRRAGMSLPYYCRHMSDMTEVDAILAYPGE